MRVEGRIIYYSLEDFKHPRIFDCVAEGSTLISKGTTEYDTCDYLYLKAGVVYAGTIGIKGILRHVEMYGPYGGPHRRLDPEYP